MRAYERFLNYVRYNTQSDPSSTSYPSTPGQLVLGEALKQELETLGLETTIDQYGYVISRLPGNMKHQAPSLALIAHMDTSPDSCGKNIKPQIIKNYAGGDIILDAVQNIILSPDVFPFMKRNIGQDLITTNGHTLLGADDKAGIAEIMTVIEYYIDNHHIPHGEIMVVFTPDEEVGNGTKYIDIAKIGSDLAYTLDGSAVGEIAYENFNAAAAVVTLNGISVHPGSAKNKLLNSISLASEFDLLLPKNMRPELTEKYEGFNHLHNIKGNVEKTTMEYIIRNHDRHLFASQKESFVVAVNILNRKYGAKTCDVVITDSYFNMKEKLSSKQEIIEIAVQAIRDTGLEPIIEPIRGGTDGARLTYMGLPCPNLGTGGYNYHGPYEYASIQEMDQAVEIVKRIIAQIAS